MIHFKDIERHRAWEPEPGVFGSFEPEPAKKKKLRSRSPSHIISPLRGKNLSLKKRVYLLSIKYLEDLYLWVYIVGHEPDEQHGVGGLGVGALVRLHMLVQPLAQSPCEIGNLNHKSQTLKLNLLFFLRVSVQESLFERSIVEEEQPLVSFKTFVLFRKEIRKIIFCEKLNIKTFSIPTFSGYC